MEQLTCNVHDTALVLEGGGYRASYSAGMVNVLLENEVYFSFVCGISAGASHTVDYLSRDKDRVRDAFIILTQRTPQAGGLRSALTGHGYFNADYDYVGAAIDGYMPFDWETFKNNPADLRIQSYDATADRDCVWTKADMVALVPMLEMVRASSTLPGIMKPIEVYGHTMYDGGLGTGAGLSTHLAEDAGYERILFVATRPAGYRKEPPSKGLLRVYRRLAKDNEALYKAMATRNERYNEALDHLERLEREGKALVIRPDVMPVSSTTINTKRLVRSYKMGHEQALRDWPRVEKWLFG